MKQITDKIMMIRPASFQYNEETADNNSFQTAGNYDLDKVNHKAIEEFDHMVEVLRSKGITVYVIQDSKSPIKPDAIFPNNWVSFHKDGSVVTYPMYAENRRIERNEGIIDSLKQDFKVERRYTFDHYELEDKFLEGTGSMLFDRENKIVYACLSPRTNVELLEKFCVLMGVKKISFRSVDRDGIDIYHTNVMMALGQDFSVICLDSIKNETERKEVIETLNSTHKQIIEIDYDQMEHFAGNMLQVASKSGEKYLVMSQAAYDSLNQSQLDHLSSLSNILPIPIPTIEKLGGGSVRCMMAEIFLPTKS